MSAQVARQALEDVAGPDGEGRDGALRRVGYSLAKMYRAYQTHRSTGKSAQTFAAPVPGASVGAGTVAIDAIARTSTADLLADLRRLGLENGAAAGGVVSGRLPIEALAEAAALPSLHSARPVFASRSIGATVSQGVEAQRTSGYRNRTGTTGEGAVVGLISDSYNNATDVPTSAEEDVRSGDLPGSGNPNGYTDPVRVLEEADEPQTDEGRALAQIVHDVAPGARLIFQTAFNGGSANFAQGIRRLADEGSTVIVDDVLFSSEPMFQDGVIAQAVDDVVFGDGVTYLSASGNNAQLSYESAFQSSGQSGPVGGDLHDFDPGPDVDIRQAFRLGPGANVRVALHWAQPAASAGGEGARTDMEVFFTDGDGTIVAQPQRRDNVGGDPYEFVSYQNQSESAQTIALGMERVEGPAPSLLKYVLFTRGSVQRIEYEQFTPTLYGHPNASGAVAVSAAAYFNTPPFNPSVDRPLVNGFVSVGGIPILFDELGRRLSGTGIDRRKPDVTGPDGVNTTFFGEDLSGIDFPAEDDTFPNFFGTSAATPHLAGLVALMQETEPGLAPRAYADALRQSAVDVRANSDGIETGEGFDTYSGSGFVRGDQLSITVPDVRAFVAAPVSGEEGALRLSWEERQGAGVDRYVVERSVAGGPFESIDVVGSDGARTYEITDTELAPGVYDYRLRLDRGDRVEAGPRARGTVAVSGDVAVEGPYPNPATGTFRLQLTAPTRQGVVLVLYDALGRQLSILDRGVLRGSRPTVIRIDDALVDRFASGRYFIRIIAEEFETSVPVTFVR